jgi:chromosome segregation ATPase
MTTSLAPDEQLWEEQRAERRLRLVNDDIEAANKQIKSLEKQKSSLQQELDNLDFQINELKTNIEAVESEEPAEPASEKGPETAQADANQDTFFTLLTQLEGEEATLKAELQSYKDLQRDLSHQKAIYAQQNKKLQNEVDAEKERLEAEEDQIRNLENNLNHLQTKLDSKLQQLSEMQELFEQLKGESKAITHKLANEDQERLTQLKREEKSKTEELAALKKTAEHKRRELDNAQRLYEKQVAQDTATLAKNKSISLWLNDRTILAGKLRKTKEQLVQVKQNHASVEKRQAALEAKFKEMLGNDDGHGNGPVARWIVHAEIESLENRANDDLAEEIRLEEEYEQELKTEFELLERSIEQFEAHRKTTLDALNQELLESDNGGYLKLLQNELNELQALAARR